MAHNGSATRLGWMFQKPDDFRAIALAANGCRQWHHGYSGSLTLAALRFLGLVQDGNSVGFGAIAVAQMLWGFVTL